MDITKSIEILSSRQNIYKCLLDPEEIAQWWQCDTVIDLKVGGVWTMGWGKNSDGFGHETVITGYIQSFESASFLSVYIEPVFINISLTDSEDGKGAVLSVTQQNYPDPAQEEAALQTWIDSFMGLKFHVEQKYPLTKASPTKESPAVGVVSSEPSLLENKGEKSGLYLLKKDDIKHSTDRLEKATVHEISFNDVPRKTLPGRKNDSGYKILDDAGFNVTNPVGKIVSYTRESGFGYIEHDELGQVMFDYEICDFAPEVGDEVVILELKKAWNGKPKCKRLACPAKGSKIK